ncbi:matrixin family metalloprotease [Azospirillum sp. RWY-5-1]|uniref:Matrixin family metalloprotease n=1 Tax=Azospirillum oleiclasticum TaxID=2735135 RepID=A0ABX2TMH7_9PROT|nr:M10 family metallopeptidase C-terminal domain-containing protein [Azospirillum oleiclasticum]NYZ17550.1 matrixin family metalloprotease [Azospirillum oleiclasticum]NYZ24652.1 matrixin family metalloprotease [Azospirillum oleiclasticum]
MPLDDTTTPRCGCALCSGLMQDTGIGRATTGSTLTGSTSVEAQGATAYYIAALLPSGAPKWGSSTAGTSATVTYSFMTVAPSYATSSDRSGFATMTEAQKTAVRAALATWAEVANITFTEVSDSGSGGSLRFGTNDQNGVSAGYAYYPSTSALGGDVYLANDQTSNVSPTAGTYGYLTILHEIGHAIGLKHPGNYNAGGGGTDGPYLPSAEDSYQYSLMSYYSHPSLGYNGLATGPALYDIAAIQYLYGANTSTRTGNDTYSFNDTTTATSRAIWDAGGTDTIDASGQTAAVTISLVAGSFSSIGPNGSGGRAANNIAIAYGATIENATGGSGNDTLTGNGGVNILTGGAGDDTLTGGTGNDTLVGGTGTDVAVFSGNRGAYTVTGSGTSLTITGSDGTDTLGDIEFAQFADSRVSLSPPTITGAAAAARTVIAGTTVAASTLFTATAPAESTITRYELRDDTATATSGYLTLSGVTQTAGSSFLVGSLGSVGFVGGSADGADSLAVRAYNGTLWSDWTTITVTTLTNRSPTVQASKSLTVQEGAPATGLGLTQPSDLDGDALTITLQALPSGGTIRLAGGTEVTSGTALSATDIAGLTFTPTTGFSGSAGSLSYTVSDGRGGTASQTVGLQVASLAGQLAAFNALAYLADYSDLAAAFGTDQAAARQHFISAGRFEGRGTGSFDAIAYIAVNTDLAAAFGTNQTVATEHYIRYGRNEGRQTTGFNALAYLAGNTDLVTAFGTDQTAALQHYISFGRTEGRSQLDATSYLAANGDLIGAFGLDISQASRHYIVNGRTEGRSTSFDAAAYMQANPDVAAAFAGNLAGATEHYVLHGYYEGRLTRPAGSGMLAA